jgi:hypothetical protein
MHVGEQLAGVFNGFSNYVLEGGGVRPHRLAIYMQRPKSAQ